MNETPPRQIRATYSKESIRVYQAFRSEIADAALTAQTFCGPFKRDRMTWIKPSFTWMMYRSGWAANPGQERILAISVKRSGFEWALEHACLSHFDSGIYPSRETWRSMLQSACVRVQWDPERAVDLQALPWRTIQIGLRGEAVDAYLADWILQIEDFTDVAKRVMRCLQTDGREAAQLLVPDERPYPLNEAIARCIGSIPGGGVDAPTA